MPCFKPLKAYRSRFLTSSGKRAITFSPIDAYVDRPLTLPCGRCVGCRLEHSRQWAIRCSHEASLHTQNSFITLTYNDAFLPPSGTLKPRDFTLFIKKLRKKLYPKLVRYYHCGEYGPKYGRPHYHACLFNHDFVDKRPFKKSKSGDMIYTSATLTEIWGMGHASLGSVNFKSAAYVARYILKKINGPLAEKPRTFLDTVTGELITLLWYQSFDPETSEVFDLVPEYTTMSRNKGIGLEWLIKYHPDVYPGDFIVINGKKMRPPRYYDTEFEIAYPSDFSRIKRQRIQAFRTYSADNTPDRLRVKEICQNARLTRLPREME